MILSTKTNVFVSVRYNRFSFAKKWNVKTAERHGNKKKKKKTNL